MNGCAKGAPQAGKTNVGFLAQPGDLFDAVVRRREAPPLRSLVERMNGGVGGRLCGDPGGQIGVTFFGHGLFERRGGEDGTI
ncbi:hypothetical protein ACSFBI_22495 [Variovorax sp. RB3P1]